jgi:hypothetical protein
MDQNFTKTTVANGNQLSINENVGIGIKNCGKK